MKAISNQQSAISNQQSAISNQHISTSAHQHISTSAKLLIFLIVMLAFSYNITAQTNTLPSSGNVGIGTTTPSAALDVYGNTKLNGRVTIDSIMVVRDSATFQNKLTVNQDLKVKQDLTIKGKSVFVDNGTFKTDLKVLGDFRIKSLADSTSTSFRIATLNNNGKLTSLDRSGLVGSIYDPQIQCFLLPNNQLPAPVWSATPGVLFTGVGCPARVGIGTDNPVSTFQVVGSGFFQGNLGINVAPTTNETVKISNTLNLTGIELINNHPTAFPLKYGIKNMVNNPNTIAYSVTDQPTNQDVFVVKGSGSVGIGTDNPLELFQIGEEFTFHSGGTKAISRNYYFDNATQSSKRIKNGFVSTLRFNDLGSIDLLVGPSDAAGSTIDFTTMKGLHIGQNGNVGIGTTSVSGAKLSVEGIIRARKIQVDNPAIVWADFVFEKSYNLLSLKEVEAFIIQNKHLPDVPTTKEVRENGIDLVQMDAILLQKIEELTLYMLQLKKENDILKEKIILLESK